MSGYLVDIIGVLFGVIMLSMLYLTWCDRERAKMQRQRLEAWRDKYLHRP